MNKEELKKFEEIKEDIKKILNLMENSVLFRDKIEEEKKQLNNEKSKLFNPNDKPTDKQIFFLKSKGIEIKKDLTKLEASKIISELKKQEMDY